MRLRTRQCGRCGSTRPPRNVRAGDTVQPVDFPSVNDVDVDLGDAPDVDVDLGDAPDESDTPPSGADPPNPTARGNQTNGPTVGSRNSARSSRRGGASWQRGPSSAVTRQQRGPTPQLPEGFLQQLQSITGSSTVHIPKCQRERLCAIAADCLEGTLADDETWAALSEAHSKLLLYGIPRNVPTVVELEQRLALWEDADFSGLLTRIQVQAEQKNKSLQREIMKS